MNYPSMDNPQIDNPNADSPSVDYPRNRRSACAVCGLDTFRHKGWFLVVENRWLDRLKILSWHSSLAAQKGIKSVCCRQHLKTLVAHWMTQASLRVPQAEFVLPAIGSDEAVGDDDFGPESVSRLVGELAVHRESFSRVWSGSPEALECILDALIAIGAENKPQALEFHLFDPPESSHESSRRLSLQ
jgi:hypothetical protein